MESLIIILILFLFFYFLLIIIRLIFAIFFLFIIKKYKNLLKIIKNKINIDTYSNKSAKEEDELLRDKKLEKKKEQVFGIAVRINNNENEMENAPQIEERIVGIVKPIGKWTQLILGQKVVGLMQHAQKLKQNNSMGYWENMIYSQRKARGRERGGRG